MAYIRLRSFSNIADCAEIAVSLVDLQQKGARGVILDFRGNQGGIVNEAVCIGNLFIGPETIVKEEAIDTKEVRSLGKKRDALTDLPMITLINAKSASASELVAGALQDYRRSWIAGERSFGKGTVQAPQDFAPDGTNRILDVQIKQTIKRFYQPSGRTNQIVGITPDFPIDPKPNATEDDRFAIREVDLFDNALSSLGDPWLQPRPARVAKIQACARTRGTAQSKASPADYQLSVAQDLLDCVIDLQGRSGK